MSQDLTDTESAFGAADDSAFEEEEHYDDGDENPLIPMFLELMVGLEAQGPEIPPSTKAFMLKVFGAGAVAASHLIIHGVETSFGPTRGVSLLEIERAGSDLLGIDTLSDDEEDTE